jgi:hypothetical protein
VCGFIYRFVEVYHFLDGLGSPGWGVSSHVLPSASGMLGCFWQFCPPVLPALLGLAYAWLSSVSVLQRVRVADY